MPGVNLPSGQGQEGEGSKHAAPARICRQLWVRGVVQGVGFRPFVYNLALAAGVDGWVRNTSAGVQIVVEGPPAAVEGFVAALPQKAPPRSYIASLDVTEQEPAGERGFRILESAVDPHAYQLVSPDIATCADCRRELLDPADRRYGYPFTNCTNCGPRFTIIESLPYDRERTTMRHFPLCPACRREYQDPTDRRFHAEPNACPVCGPRTVLLARGGPAGIEPAATVADVLGRGEAAPSRAGDGSMAMVADVPDRGTPSAAGASGLEGMAAGAESGPAGLVVLARSDETAPAAVMAPAADLLRAGRILALKGLGGFHIACDATDEAAVRELKRRKGRPHKPLAVMFADVSQVRAHCAVSAAEALLLESPEHPIVLLEWRRVGRSGEPLDEVGDGSAAAAISPQVAVRQRYLGAMLPYTPLHLLLLRASGRPLVMTSGNLAEEPIVTTWQEAHRLAPIADAYLLHDRRIHARYDDSVALVRRGKPRLVRRSRGYAPFPVPLPRDLPQVLACGAELKNTFCLTRDGNAFLSQHIGDLENLETLEHFEASVALYQRLFRLEPAVVAHDLHPEYLATKYAVALQRAARGPGGARGGRADGSVDGSADGCAHSSADGSADAPGSAAGDPASGIESIGVQHHHAHIVSCMVENGAVEAPAGASTALQQVIGISLDGLGYGTDGALWGGEVLVCDALGFRRATHLEYLPLPGGELAIRRPARTAAGWLATLLGPQAVDRALSLGLDLREDEAAVVVRQALDGVNAPLTSSCGRLFDCVAALCGLRGSITYEGQAAIELEMVSSPGGEPYPFVVDGDPASVLNGPADKAGAPAVVRLGPLLGAVLDDAAAGRTAGHVGSRLHTTLAALVLDLCTALRSAGAPGTVALSGGVFQNRLLTELCETALERVGFHVLTHALVPANDGGLALGQAVIAGYNHMARDGKRIERAAIVRQESG